MDKKRILDLYKDVKSEKIDLSDLTEEELKCVLKLYNQEIKLVNDKIALEKQEINEMKKRIEVLIKRKNKD